MADEMITTATKEGHIHTHNTLHITNISLSLSCRSLILVQPYEVFWSWLYLSYYLTRLSFRTTLRTKSGRVLASSPYDRMLASVYIINLE